ncbi:MAG: ABC transporter ATP-binding protein, partial [Candidatus Bathyarchaeia archaeon]
MLLKIEDLYFSYPGGCEVLKAIDFFAEGGEVVSIIGPNGSGKTTLLMTAAGLLEPTMGAVFLDGQNLKNLLPNVRKRIGLVFQDPDDQLFNPTVYEELAFALRQLYTSKDQVNNRITEVADQFSLKPHLEKSPFKLSIGEKRLVTIASILAYDPDIILFDEPTANLSSSPIEVIGDLILKMKYLGKVVIVASHDVEFVAEVSDRIYILNSGNLKGGSDARSILMDEALLSLADMKPPIVMQT